MSALTTVVVLCGLTWVAVSPSSSPAPQRAALPSTFEGYLATAVKPSARERQTMMSGSPIAKLLDSDASKEVAVFGAVWVNAAPARYVRQVKDIENFERGGPFRITKRISDPPRLEDFAQLQLPAEPRRLERGIQAAHEPWMLGRDTGRTVIGVTLLRLDASDRDHRLAPDADRRGSDPDEHGYAFLGKTV